jgi:hypothetical protein
MTKKEKLLIEIRSKMNDVEFSTLGLTEFDSLDHLKEVAASLHVKENSTIDQVVDEPVKDEPVKDEPEKDEPEKDEPVTDEPKNDYDELIGKIEGASAPPKVEKKKKPLVERKTRKAKKGTSDPEATRIEGFILLIAVDTIFPFSLSFLNNLLDKKGKKITPQELKLDQQSFDKLEPLADQAADYMTFNINPVAGFFIASALMYSNNLINLKMVGNNLTE